MNEQERIALLEKLVREAQALLSSDPWEVAYGTDDGWITNYTGPFDKERKSWLEQAKSVVGEQEAH